MEKYLPPGLAMLLTVGGYYLERSIFAAGLQAMTDDRWIAYALGGFVFLLWALAMLVITATYKDFGEGEVLFTSSQVIRLSE